MSDKDILAYDPFGYDDDPDVRRLSDKIVVFVKDHDCQMCGKIAHQGTSGRAIREVNRSERKAMTFYFCCTCCVAMGGVWLDGGDAVDARVLLHPNMKHLRV